MGRDGSQPSYQSSHGLSNERAAGAERDRPKWWIRCHGSQRWRLEEQDDEHDRDIVVGEQEIKIDQESSKRARYPVQPAQRWSNPSFPAPRCWNSSAKCCPTAPTTNTTTASSWPGPESFSISATIISITARRLRPLEQPQDGDRRAQQPTGRHGHRTRWNHGPRPPQRLCLTTKWPARLSF